MSKVKVAGFSVSIDGFGAGPRQDLQNPLGLRGPEMFAWFFQTDAWKKMHGQGEGGRGIDNDFALRAFENVGAWILGRNMFGPVRGPWPDDTWKGWWGESPPYHVPVFVLTHYPRESIVMQGGTTFHFVTDGIHAALGHAKAAANGKDVRIGGGVAVIQQYLRARLIDELHIAIAPVLLGSGERLFADTDMVELGYRCTEHVSTEKASHFVMRR